MSPIFRVACVAALFLLYALAAHLDAPPTLGHLVEPLGRGEHLARLQQPCTLAARPTVDARGHHG